MDLSNFVIKIGLYKPTEPFPVHDFSKFENTEYGRTHGLVAASQTQLNEQIKSKLRLEPTAKEIRYFYYEAVNE